MTLMPMATKDVPFKDLDEAILQRFGRNTGLAPGAVQKNFWFIYNVKPAD